jgi:hypothetical protein
MASSGVAKREAERKEKGRREEMGEGHLIVTEPTPSDPEPMSAPVPWSLAWSENGELAPQDRFDLLQSLVLTESVEVQTTLIATIENLPLEQVSLLCTDGVTSLWS